MTASPLDLRMLRGDFERLYGARALAFLIGGYDGSGNFGDVLMVGEDVAAVAGAGDITPVVVTDPRNLERVETCRAGSAALRNALVLFAGTPRGVTAGADRLLPVEVPPPVPTALLMAGGGYVNERWGHGRLDMLDAVQSWLATSDNPRSKAASPFLFGLQVAPTAFEGELRARFAALVSRASGVGLRDPGSLKRVREALPEFQTKAFFSGDDAVFALLASCVRRVPGETIGIHLSQKLHTAESTRLVVEALKLSADVPRQINMFAGHEDLFVSETEQQDEAALSLRAAGFAVDRFACLENTAEILNRIAAGSLTISCSYHVALASLVNGVPAILLAEDTHYFEKHTGIAELFGLPSDFVVDVKRTTAADLAVVVARALNKSVRADLAGPIQRGALQLASARADAVQRLQAMLREILSEAGERDLAETTAELTRTAARLAELRRANNAMVADAQRVIETQNGPDRRAADAAEARANHLAQELQALQAELAVSRHRAEELQAALALGQAHITNLEAMLNTRAAKVARVGAHVVGKLRPPRGR